MLIYPRYIVDTYEPTYLSISTKTFAGNTKQTDIILFHSRNLGALIVDERPHVKSWDEPQYSIQNLGIEESYGFGVLTKVRRLRSQGGHHSRESEMSTPGAIDHLDR